MIDCRASGTLGRCESETFDASVYSAGAFLLTHPSSDICSGSATDSDSISAMAEAMAARR